ncbi:MAG: hypothetical protein M4579_006033 [Chaenotheca gracillima]|nr:MAG: hypothetical protein M4579_006033 [Chaenotheca gracillima]
MLRQNIVSALLALQLLPSWVGAVQDPPRPYQLADSELGSTSILNHTQYVDSYDDYQWYLDNIPFIDIPDKTIQDVYYYRATVIKRHLKFAHEGHGWVFTEFIHPVAWASKFQTIPDSAGHQILEGRWLRNPQYTKDVISLYTRAGAETVSSISYTHFIHRAIYEHAQATGDQTFLTSQLDGMITMFNLWNGTKDSKTGLYHRTPLLDAQEFSLPGFMTGGPMGGPVEEWNSFDNNFTTIDLGPETYRPSFNAYMVAAAQSISEVAQLAGNTSVAQQWNETASDLYDRMYSYLWDSESRFWIDVVQGTNLNVTGRQMIGYYPYRFDLNTDDESIRGLEAGLTSHGFVSDFGPTTLEQSNPYYTDFKNITYCCLWQGQSWPFSTSVYLGTLARIARENRSSVITPEFFQQAMSTYARTNYKDGVPYTAEAHYPTIDTWSGDTSNHSEHYLHSTYFDNVFTNLFGIIPTLDDRLEMMPLVPDNWTYFAIENIPYHGSLFSIVWDQNGDHYPSANGSKGLSIYSNGSLLHSQSDLSAFNVSLSNGTQAAAALAAQPRYENILANPNAPWGFPNVTADYLFTANGDASSTQPYKMNDGLLWYDATPDNYWTNNQTSVPFTTVNITLPRPRNFSSLSLAIIDDTAQGGAITCPAGIQIRNNDGAVLAERNPWDTCVPNALNTILFDRPSDDSSNATTTAPSGGAVVETDNITVLISNGLSQAVSITEIQIWVLSTPGPRYEVEDGLLGTFIGGFEGRARGLNSTISDGSVHLGEGSWAEIGNVRAGDQTSTTTASGGQMQNMTVIGGGQGSVAVQMNFLTNATVDFDGSAEKKIEVPFLAGGNVVTIFQTEGTPSVDAIVVG